MTIYMLLDDEPRPSSATNTGVCPIAYATSADILVRSIEISYHKRSVKVDRQDMKVRVVSTEPKTNGFILKQFLIAIVPVMDRPDHL